MLDFITRSKNLKLKYNQTRQLTTDTFNELVDLIVSLTMSTDGSGSDSGIGEQMSASIIRDKLQTLFDGDRLNASAIQGLTEAVEDVINDPTSGDSAQVIRDKLQTLITTQRLDVSAIKNLIASNIAYSSVSSTISIKNVVDSILTTISVLSIVDPANTFLNGQGEYATIKWNDIQDKPLDLGDKNQVFLFDQPTTVWTINHTLNKRPSVTILDISGSLIRGQIDYLLDNATIIITFNQPMSGEVILN